MPFLQLMSIHTAAYHLPREIGESSKIVPTFTENCFLQERQRHVLREAIAALSGELQNGQNTPSGQRRAAAYSKALSGSAKKMIASCSVGGTYRPGRRARAFFLGIRTI